jgi:hypothetical protein
MDFTFTNATDSLNMKGTELKVVCCIVHQSNRSLAVVV